MSFPGALSGGGGLMRRFSHLTKGGVSSDRVSVIHLIGLSGDISVEYQAQLVFVAGMGMVGCVFTPIGGVSRR